MTFRLRSFSTQFLFGIGLSLTVGACRSAPPEDPPTEPPFEVQVHEYQGSLLEGPLSGEARFESVDPAEALRFTAEILIAEGSLAGELDPLALHARLVFNAPAESLLIPTPILARGVRLARGGEADAFLDRLRAGELGPVRPASTESAVLPRNVTVEVRIEEDENADSAYVGSVRRLSLYAVDGACSVTLICRISPGLTPSFRTSVIN